MSVITPNTDFVLLKSNIELDNRNQLTFSNATNQYNYFNSLNKLVAENFTYQRQDETVRFPANRDDIIEYNYCMYRNSSYGNKWFYAYITDMKYISNEVTAISIKTDVYQTWCFDLTFKSSFVEREHVNNDTVGLHTIPENLETGEYISTNLQPISSNNLEELDTCFCVGATENIITSGYSTLNEKLPSGIYYIGCTTLQGVRDIVSKYDIAGKGDAINSVFVIPKAFFSSFENVTGIDGQVSTTITFTYNTELTITQSPTIGKNYTPKNNKLRCWPYNFLQVSNHNGTIVNYRWELFNLVQGGNEYKFNFRGALTPGGSFSAYPFDYKNIINNFDEAISLGKYPIGGWNNDVYTNWMTQNGVNIAGITLNAEQKGIVGGALMTGLGLGQLLGGNMFGAGTMSSGLGQIANAVQENYRHSLAPDQAGGNTNVGDYSYAFDLTNLEFKRITINNEYCKIIDDYFSMYGYKVNSLKIPNIIGRANWNYVKTIGVNIEGYIPQKDLQEIKDMLNSGITFWHNPSTFLDYSQTNSIV